MPAVAAQATPHMSTAIADILSGAVTPASPIASGGTVTIASGYVYHTFTTTGTLKVYQAGVIDYLVVGGGGGGGDGLAGVRYPAGGAGGTARTATGYSLSVGTLTVTVGAAGTAGTGNSGVDGGSGGSSSLGGVVTATGGTGGGAAGNAIGGSNADFSGAAGVGGHGAGGGAGAGANASTVNGGNGITWLDGVAYGGGGGALNDSGYGTGGTGGGGVGNGTAAGTNGRGGGGAGKGDGDGAIGGTGVVIVRYPLVTANYATGGTVTSDSTNIIHTFTANGTFALAQAGLLTADYLVVGGGGGSTNGTSGVNFGSGGGGGQVTAASAQSIIANQSVTVGTGGIATGLSGAANNGTSSSLGSLATAAGGICAIATSRVGGTSGNAHTGGTGGGANGSGGGGGDSANGSVSNAGAGTSSSITGSALGYGGGGAGRVDGGASGTSSDGGANGSSNARANSGGGGYGDGARGGADGIVVVRYSPGAFQPGHPLGFGAVAVWYDASDAATITAVAGAVSQWNDKSGNAYNQVQSSAGKKPTTGSATIGGVNAVDFDGSSDGMQVASAAIPAGQTIFFAGNIQTAASTSVILEHSADWNANNGEIFYVDSTTVNIGLRRSATASARIWTLSPTGTHIWTTGYDGTNASHYLRKDGVDQGAGTSPGAPYNNNLGTGSVTTALNIGARNDGASIWLDAPIGTVGIISSFLTSGQRASLERWLANAWGITI